jgi:hypothetical protein
MPTTTYKGFITDMQQNRLLPITRAELVLDANGKVALRSEEFLAQGEMPGLVTAAERELLTNLADSSTNTNLKEILESINTSLYIDTSPVVLYRTSDTAPTYIKCSDGLTVTKTNNTFTFNLAAAYQATTINTTGHVIKSIATDSYGRVQSVTGGALTSDELPAEISGKTFIDCKIDGSPVVNQDYVDTKFNNVGAIATGALQFSGTISNQESIAQLISNHDFNKYYKITGYDLYIPKEYVYGSTSTVNTPLDFGDTIVTYKDSSDKFKFVIIPSGDDDLSIGIYNDSAGAGDVFAINATSPLSFSVSNNIATLTLPNVANSEKGGYLSKNDYDTFKSYASAHAVSYTPSTNLTSTITIGTLTIGGTPIEVKSQAYDYTLAVDHNHKITLKDGNVGKGEVTVLGSNGINITSKASDKTITIEGYTVANASEALLDISDEGEISITKANAENLTTAGVVTNDVLSSAMALYCVSFQTINSSLATVQNLKSLVTVNI